MRALRPHVIRAACTSSPLLRRRGPLPRHWHVVQLAGCVRCNASCQAIEPSSGARKRYGLLIDGDVFGKSHFSAIVAAVRARGDVSHGYVFGSKSAANKSRAEELSSLGLKFVNVARNRSGTKDPNDIAISIEASRLAFEKHVDGIALAAPDTDFVLLIDRLVQVGCSVLALLPDKTSPGVAREFQNSFAEVLWFSTKEQAVRQPKRKILLQASGSSTIEPLDAAGLEDQFKVDAAALARVRSDLLDLDYLDNPESPLLPAVAKFFHVNALGPLTVWPKHLAFSEAASVLAKQSRSWTRNPHSFVFVLPCGTQTKTKKWLELCGSAKGIEFIRGGGAFLVRDTELLVVETLRRLGYIDLDLNTHLGDAIDLFSEMKDNHKALQLLGLSIRSCLPEHTKKALLHCALVSPKLHGEWQVAPRDDLVRDFLTSRGWLSSERSSKPDVFLAAQQYSAKHGLEQRKTYNGMVKLILDHLTSGDPSRRR